MNSNLPIDLEKVIELSKKYPLCNYCLGRVFAKYGLNLGNNERGLAIKTILQMYLYMKLLNNELSKEDLKTIASNLGDPIDRLYEKLFNEKITVKECYICRNKLSRNYLEELSSRIASDLFKNNASSFLIGVTISKDTILRELEVYRLFGLETSESIKNELKREIGKLINTKYGFKPDFKNPDVLVVVDFENNSYELVINPILFEGRYWKRGRNISLNTWIDRYGNLKYPCSLENFLKNKLSNLFKTSEIIIHASGREDVDARTLGSGGPVVIEIKKPINRVLDLNLINDLLKTSLLEFKLYSLTSRGRVKYYKTEGSKKAKVYKLLVYSEKEITPEQLHSLEEFFKNTVVEQYTPSRVLRRRGERVRIRRVYEIRNRYLNPYLFETIICCDGGLYVKELIHGDNGRTKPNYADYLGSRLYPLEIDIVHVFHNVVE